MNNLFTDFDEQSIEDWKSKIISDLKGKELNSINWQSEIGEISPIQHPTNSNFCSTEAQLIDSNKWSFHQFFDASKENCNQQIRKALQGGTNSIYLSNTSSQNLSNVLSEVMVDIIETHLSTNCENYLDIVASFSEFCKQMDKSKLNGGFIFDPVYHYITTGNWQQNKEQDFAPLKDSNIISNDFRNFGLIQVNAAIYGEAGANIDEQIALALAHGNEYLNYLTNSNISIAEIAHKITFRFAVGTSYFLEIAKLRAFKALWKTILNEYCDASIVYTKTKAVNSELYYSNKDIYNNMLRATTSAMSAAISGYDAIEVQPYNSIVKSNDDFANRIARNIQLILQEESYLDKVIDPANGSYYIENLTNQLMEISWKKFQKIEAEGGLLNCFDKGTIQATIKENLEQKLDDLKNEKRSMIGVNKFINEQENVASMRGFSTDSDKALHPANLSNLLELASKPA